MLKCAFKMMINVKHRHDWSRVCPQQKDKCWKKVPALFKIIKT
jgi:hypothetical protein